VAGEEIVLFNFKNKSLGLKIIIAIIVVMICIYVFFPTYWMVITAFKSSSEIYNYNPTFIPLKPTLNNFRSVLTDKKMLTYFKNSLFVSLVSCMLATLVAAYAGYSFSKFRYHGRKSFMYLILTAQMFPFAVLLLTIYLMMRRFGLLDNYLSLVLSYITFTLPIGTWALKSFFDQIPDSLIESAKIDGASKIVIVHNIMFPLAIPGLVSTAIYGFVWSWNDLLYSLTLINSPASRTLAPGLIMTYLGQFQQNWTNMMAASVTASIPVTLMFIFLQRFFIQGLTAGAVKE
jgi:multiple sugar transport system permease protein